MRVFRVPELLGSALMLGLLGTLLLFVSRTFLMNRLVLDFAHMLAGSLVLLSFLQLYQDRLSALVNIFALHAFVLALSVAWQAYIQDAPHLYITGRDCSRLQGHCHPGGPATHYRKARNSPRDRDRWWNWADHAPGDWACCSFHGGDVARDGRRGPADARGSRLFAVRSVVGPSSHGHPQKRG